MKCSFLEEVRAFGKRHGLWMRGDRILTAVSGGPDSLALLLALHALAEEEGFSLACCVVNHHLRPEAGEEANFVARTAAELSIPCQIQDVNVPEERQRSGGSVETVARTLRYAALRQAARSMDCRKIAVAHHKGDQAETVLYHLIRGSGMDGLRGMRPVSEDVIRPFLDVSREEILNFLKGFPYEPCHDATNDQMEAVRNRIRLQLLPLLRTFNPQITDALCRTAFLLNDENEYLNEEALARMSLCRWEGDGCRLPLTDFLDLPEVMQRRLLRLLWVRCGGRTPDLAALSRVQSFLREGGNGRWTSAAGIAVRLHGGEAFFQPGSTRAGIPAEPPSWELQEEYFSSRPPAAGPDQLLLDADQVGPLRIRFRRQGDRFAPQGMTGTKSMARYMNELHIPAELRDCWPLVADDTHIYWLGEGRPSRLGRPSAATRHYIRLTLRRKSHEKPDERH